MAGKRSKSKAEDENLIAQQFPELNRKFYSSNPAAYFRSRLHLLMLAAGATDEINELLAKGVHYEKLLAQVDFTEPSDDERRVHQAFVITEAEALLHHVSEALLRLFFAHADSPHCPWLEVARLRNFSEFKARIELFRDQPPSVELSQQLATVFLGAVPAESDELRVAAVANIERLLRLLCARLLEDKNFYNAAKHGLAILAGNASIAMSDSEGNSVAGSKGASVTYLETRETDTGQKWHETTRWVSPRQAMWLATIATTQMVSLWAVAQARYTGVAIEGVEAVTKEAVDDAITGEFASQQPITRISVRLHYSA